MSDTETKRTGGNVNIFRLRGTIVGMLVLREGITSVRMAVEGSGRGRGARRNEFRPDAQRQRNVEIPRDLPTMEYHGSVADIDSYADKRVEVSGHIETKTSTAHDTFNVYVIDNISPEKRLLLSYFDDIEDIPGGHRSDSNEVVLSGPIHSIRIPVDGSGNSRPNVTYVTVKTTVNGKTYTPQFSCFDKQSDFVRKCKEGDIVSAACSIRTRSLEPRPESSRNASGSRRGLMNGGLMATLAQNVTCLDIARPIIKETEPPAVADTGTAPDTE